MNLSGKGINLSWDESKHPRDADGKFTSKGKIYSTLVNAIPIPPKKSVKDGELSHLQYNISKLQSFVSKEGLLNTIKEEVLDIFKVEVQKFLQKKVKELANRL
jgi:hypothetical protein